MADQGGSDASKNARRYVGRCMGAPDAHVCPTRRLRRVLCPLQTPLVTARRGAELRQLKTRRTPATRPRSAPTPSTACLRFNFPQFHRARVCDEIPKSPFRVQELIFTILPARFIFVSMLLCGFLR